MKTTLKTVPPHQKFPLVDAILLIPKEGKDGQIGICTNTSAPGQVLGEIDEENRKNICVLGSLIVSRDGVERMILNTLAHPTLKYLILFSEESVTFAPSTNLLSAIMNGFDDKKDGNYIKGGVAASAHYPNLNENIMNGFRNEIVVLPVFMYTNGKSKEVIGKYLDWVRPKINGELFSFLKNLLGKEKIYYDSLNKVIELVKKLPENKKNFVYLDPKEFQQLQPPTIELENYDKKIACPFSVKAENGAVRLDIKIGGKNYFIIHENAFLVGYSLMKFLGKNKNLLSGVEQLLLGAELGRATVEIGNKIKFPSFINSPKNMSEKTEEIPIQSLVVLKIDEKFYYRITVSGPSKGIGAGKKIKALCMAFDICAEFFELSSEKAMPIIEKLAKENRFADYEMDILHRIDIGTQIGRAAISAKLGYSFIQDFNTIFKVNKTKLPFVIVESDNFLDAHKSVLQKIYTEGITSEHGDSWKGLARTASVLAIYRNAEKTLLSLPRLYKQGSLDTETMRAKYKEELLRKDHDGTYTYGERTRSYFGFDQLLQTSEILKKDPSLATIIQRFDPSKDMSYWVEKEAGKIKFTHDPCLTHDIFFIKDGKLHSFHIARAHNTVNAYPENIFGLYDAYVSNIREKLGLKSGDMYMLSNRANILLITEEQRTKKILSEPSKTIGKVDVSSGPYLIGKGVADTESCGGVAYFKEKAKIVSKKPKSEILNRLKNYEGVDTFEKALKYLKEKGVSHNNPILTEYFAGKSNPQADQLVFFQANVYGKKVYATAVFANRSISKKDEDLNLCDYLMTEYSKKLGYPLGEIVVIYVGFKN
jgi:thymidylate synthase/tetrahydromethanopterin S-methyltransferase subunit A